MSKKKNKAPSTGGIVYSTDPDWSPQQASSEAETLSNDYAYSTSALAEEARRLSSSWASSGLTTI